MSGMSDIALTTIAAAHLEERFIKAGASLVWSVPPSKQYALTRGMQMHARRAVHALSAGKPLPDRPTGAQAKLWLTAAHISTLNKLYFAQMNDFVLSVAADLGRLAPLFADPDTVQRTFARGRVVTTD